MAIYITNLVLSFQLLLSGNCYDFNQTITQENIPILITTTETDSDTTAPKRGDGRREA